MYRYDDIDQRLVDQRVAQFRDQTRRFLAGELSEDEFRPLRLRNGLYIQRHAPMLRIADSVRAAVARSSCASWRTSRASTTAATATSPRARTCSSTGRSSRTVPDILGELATRADARDPDQRQLRPQHHHRPLRRRRARRDRRSAAVLRDHAPVVDAAPRVHLPAAQVQDRGHRLAGGSRRVARARHRPAPASAMPTAKSASRCSSAAAWAARRSSASVIREFLPLAAAADVPRSDPARLQPLRPPRQHPQGAHQDPREGASASQKFREQVEAEWRQLRSDSAPRARRGRGRARRRVLRAAGVRDAARTSDVAAGRDARVPRPGIASNTRTHKVPGYRAVYAVAQGAGVPPGDMTADQMDARRRPRRPLSASASCASRTTRTCCSPTCASATASRCGSELQSARPRDAEHRHADRHDLPAPGGDFCALANASSIPIAEAIQRALRRPRLPATTSARSSSTSPAA